MNDDLKQLLGARSIRRIDVHQPDGKWDCDLLHHQADSSNVVSVRCDGQLPAADELAILFSSIIGSRAQGLDDEHSDTDRRGFFMAGPSIELSIAGAPAQVVNDQDQLCYWELSKCMRLAGQSNPTVLECLYSPLVEMISPQIADEFQSLIESNAFLSRRIYNTCVGYAERQFRKYITPDRPDKIRWRHMAHLIRILQTAEKTLTTGRFEITLAPDQRSLIRDLKAGAVSIEQFEHLRTNLLARCEAAYSRTTLPNSADWQSIGRFVTALKLKAIQR